MSTLQVGQRVAYVEVRDSALAREVLARPDDFPPDNALVAVEPLSARALRILADADFALPPVLASATGELHRLSRRVVTSFFTPAMVAAAVPLIQRETVARVDDANAALEAGPVDLAAAIAAPVPLVVMRHLTGIDCPAELKIWSRDSLELFWGEPDAQRQQELARTAADYYRWLRGEVRNSRGSGNLFGALAAEGLTETQICALGYFLLIAGHETTAMLIATALYRALEHPGRWPELAGEAAARVFVRHVLATESSVPTWRRVAARDTSLGGEEIAAGTELLLHLSGEHGRCPAANDYALAFGYGIHRCIGAALAETEATVILEATARQLRPVTLHDHEPPWRRLLSFQAPEHVLVTRLER